MSLVHRTAVAIERPVSQDLRKDQNFQSYFSNIQNRGLTSDVARESENKKAYVAL